jgi:lipoate-protein ligase A
MLSAPPHPAIGRGATRTHELRWRLVRDEPRSGAWNMALDHALAARLGPDEGVVRLYAWSAPTVSFGKNEPAVRLDVGPEPEYVRRPTGGRAVLHDREVTYAVVAPLDAFGGLREAYRLVNEALAGAMRALGVDVELATGAPSRAPPLDAGACFRTPAPGEIVSGGRKLVGSAQARIEGALLQHGAILLENDQGALGPADARPVTLRELLASPVDPGAVEAAVADSVRGTFGGDWADVGYDAREMETAERWVEERYARDEWTWRR